MTKKELEQYRTIINELSEVSAEVKRRSASDAVKGSDREFPYRSHTMIISGIPGCEDNERVMAHKKRLESEKQRIERFVSGIDDPILKKIFYLRYIYGARKPTWQRVAGLVGHYDEQFPRKAHNKYLREVNANDPS